MGTRKPVVNPKSEIPMTLGLDGLGGELQPRPKWVRLPPASLSELKTIA